MRLKAIHLFLVLFLALFLCACEAGEIGNKLRWLDDKIGEGLNEIDGKSTAPLNIGEKREGQEVKNINFDSLSKEQKEKIDKWLEDKKLNRYGDEEGTFYDTGTPLFNEATNERIDRYDYILKNHPELSGEIFESYE